MATMGGDETDPPVAQQAVGVRTALPPLPEDFPQKYQRLAYWCPICQGWRVAECPAHGRPPTEGVDRSDREVSAAQEQRERRRAAMETLEARVEQLFLREGDAVFALWWALKRELRLGAADMLDFVELAQAKRAELVDMEQVERLLDRFALEEAPAAAGAAVSTPATAPALAAPAVGVTVGAAPPLVTGTVTVVPAVADARRSPAGKERTDGKRQ